jgi:hypothetical protein
MIGVKIGENYVLAPNTEDTSKGQGISSQTESVKYSAPSDTIPEQRRSRESEEDSFVDDELLIKSMQKDHEKSLLNSSSKRIIPSTGTISSPISIDTSKIVAVDTFTYLLFPCDKNLNTEDWPPLPIITDVTGDSQSPMVGSSDYIVQSPKSSPDVDVQAEGFSTRFSSRIQEEANMDMRDKATNISKKRNLEGNHDTAPNPLANNSFAVLSNNQIIVKANLMGVKIPNNDYSHVNLLRELEAARSSLSIENTPKVKPIASLFIESSAGQSTPLSMD